MADVVNMCAKSGELANDSGPVKQALLSEQPD
jgi:hypothetical protein